MRFILLLCISLSLFGLGDNNSTCKEKKVLVAPPSISVQAKKKRFIKLLLPAVQEVHNKLMQRYEKIAKDIQEKKNLHEIALFKEKYKAKSDEDLLARLKPHPISITLAQAAMESSWATSRFFQEANNVFGMWSTHSKEARIAAGEKRGGTRTIWLKKFDTIEDSIHAYYEMIAKGKAYDKFRQLRLLYDDPYKITPGLDKYSEMGPNYVKVINQVIRYNHFRKYDS